MKDRIQVPLIILLFAGFSAIFLWSSDRKIEGKKPLPYGWVRPQDQAKPSSRKSDFMSTATCYPGSDAAIPYYGGDYSPVIVPLWSKVNKTTDPPATPSAVPSISFPVDNGGNSSVIFGLASLPVDVGTCTQIVINVHIASNANCDPIIGFVVGGTLQSYPSPSVVTGWFTATFTGLSLTQADIAALAGTGNNGIMVAANQDGPGAGTMVVDEVQVVFTYTPSGPPPSSGDQYLSLLGVGG